MTDADRSFLKAWIAEAGKLGLSRWERLALILFLAFLIVAARLGLAKLPLPPGDPTPSNTTDDAQHAPTDAEWGSGLDPDDRPQG